MKVNPTPVLISVIVLALSVLLRVDNHATASWVIPAVWLGCLFLGAFVPAPAPKGPQRKW